LYLLFKRAKNLVTDRDIRYEEEGMISVYFCTHSDQLFGLEVLEEQLPDHNTDKSR